jgi:hypothetical protein
MPTWHNTEGHQPVCNISYRLLCLRAVELYYHTFKHNCLLLPATATYRHIATATATATVTYRHTQWFDSWHLLHRHCFQATIVAGIARLLAAYIMFHNNNTN